MYGFTTTLNGISFDQALTTTIAALKTEGFGVLSDIDVQHAMKEKLGVDARAPRWPVSCCETSARAKASRPISLPFTPTTARR